MSYKGFTIENETVKNKNGFKVSPDVNGYYHIPPSEMLTIEQLKAKLAPIPGYVKSETKITGAMLTLKDGSKKIVKAKEPIIYDTPNAAIVTPKEETTCNVTPKVAVSHNVTPKRKGELNPKHKGIWIIGGKRFTSLRAASEATGLRANTIIKVCLLGCSFEPK